MGSLGVVFSRRWGGLLAWGVSWGSWRGSFLGLLAWGSLRPPGVVLSWASWRGVLLARIILVISIGPGIRGSILLENGKIATRLRKADYPHFFEKKHEKSTRKKR